MAQRFKVYAVAYGIDPVTHSPVSNLKFGTWGECQSYISGVNGANYKGFFSDTEADLWLERQQGMPRAAKKAPPKPDPNPEYQPPVKSKRFKTHALDKQKEEIKERFATKCVNLGLDPNSVIYYLMAQWNDMTSFFGIVPDEPQTPEEEDDDPPWF